MDTDAAPAAKGVTCDAGSAGRLEQWIAVCNILARLRERRLRMQVLGDRRRCSACRKGEALPDRASGGDMRRWACGGAGRLAQAALGAQRAHQQPAALAPAVF